MTRVALKFQAEILAGATGETRFCYPVGRPSERDLRDRGTIARVFAIRCTFDYHIATCARHIDELMDVPFV